MRAAFLNNYNNEDDDNKNNDGEDDDDDYDDNYDDNNNIVTRGASINGMVYSANGALIVNARSRRFRGQC